MAKSRRDEILDAGLKVLVKNGWQKTSMIAIAREASASKETLYNWFGDKEGFFEALVRRNAESLDKSLAGVTDLRDGLVQFGKSLLTLLMSDSSVALNRAAIAQVGSDGRLGALLVAQGRDASMPILASFLKKHGFEGRDIGEAYLGLLKGDWQISRLLGVMAEPGASEIEHRAQFAADRFIGAFS